MLIKDEIKISSITIAKNEASNIKRCIESLLPFVDDIVIVVDDTTTDDTLKIASSYNKTNCQVIKWQGYAETKSVAISFCKHDWILWIDADEEVTPELVDELKQFKLSTPNYYLYDVARRAYFLGKWIKHSGWYPSRIKRLFNKQHVQFDSKKVHEGLIGVSEFGHLKNDLNHYTDPSIEHYFTKFNNYTSLAAKGMAADKKKSSIRDILLRPAFLFFKMYILRRGFLDGLHGFILAIFSSAYVFTKYCKLWELNRNK